MIDLLRSDAGAVTYHDGADVERRLSPRPYLMATTPTGTPVTDAFPEDHLHHLGVSVALPDVNGTSFWGGRTFRRGTGSVMLDNHGTQQVLERQVAPGCVSEQLVWLDRQGEPLLTESRLVAAREVPGEHGAAWDITWTSRLTAAVDVSFGSPQTNGRPGAFYGGVFWRAPFPRATVRTADGEGADAVHGSTSPWIVVEGQDAALVAATTTGLPWFVRDEGYVGFLPAVAVDERRSLAQGETLMLDLAVSVSDRPAAEAGAVADRMLDAMRFPV